MIPHAADMTPEPDIRRDAIHSLLMRVLGPLADEPTATAEETAKLLRCGRSATYEAIRAGQIPSLHIGRRVVVPVPALAAMLLGLNDKTALVGGGLVRAIGLVGTDDAASG